MTFRDKLRKFYQEKTLIYLVVGPMHYWHAARITEFGDDYLEFQFYHDGNFLDPYGLYNYRLNEIHGAHEYTIEFKKKELEQILKMSSEKENKDV